MPGGRPAPAVQAVVRLARALRGHRPELVQSFLFHANVAARLAAPWACRPWVVGGLRVAEHRKRWHLVLDRLTAPLASGSVCVSRGVLEFSRRTGGLDPRRLTVIPNGIDPEPFDRACAVPRGTLGVPEDAQLALAVGRLDAQKGIPDLLAAAEQVIAADPTWHLALAGDGPRRAWLVDQLAARPALRGRVHWLGARDDIPALLKSADVLVLASLWEGMPNVVLEAMAAGRAVVATAVEGTGNSSSPGRPDGWYPPRTRRHSARRCSRPLGIPGSAADWVGMAGHAVEAEFSLARTVAAYDRLWAGLLGYRGSLADSLASDIMNA